MSDNALIKEHDPAISSRQCSIIPDEVAPLANKQKIYFWQKWALPPETAEEDKLTFFEIKEADISIREVLREFESKTIGKKLLFSEVPARKNTSVKKWIKQIIDSYPERNDDVVENLLDTFRASLFPRSKERYQQIVGLLLLHDVLLLIHSKKDRSLAQWNQDIHPVNLILYRKNVLRAAIIRNEKGKVTFSAFEHNRNWSKGHAEFWGIAPEDISWDQLGHITLFVELPAFDYSIQLAIESEELESMISKRLISPAGSIRIGKEDGKITYAEVFRKHMDFNQFYNFYITEKEKLSDFKRKFRELIPDGEYRNTYNYDKNLKDVYIYKEEVDKILEITIEGDKPIYEKRHPRYVICFFTKEYPRIKPSMNLVTKIYDSIFNNYPLEIWHAGEEISNEPIMIGALEIYNDIEVDADFLAFSTSLLNMIQDVRSKKASFIFQHYFCSLWSTYLKNRHIRSIFDFLREDIIIPDLEFEFSSNGLFDKEDSLEFKSADDVDSKPNNFLEKTLLPTVKKYIKDGKLTRKCILYGIEDNCEIKPIPRRRLPSDKLGDIERAINKELNKDKLNVVIQPIPIKEELILAVLMIPVFEAESGKKSCMTSENEMPAFESS